MIFKLRILYYFLITRYARRFANRAELEAYQDRRIRKFLLWVRRRSTFYREWLGVDFLNPGQARIIDKKIMMENFTALNTVGIDRDEAFALAFNAEETRDFTPKINGVTIGLSSGTSGSRGLFLVSDHERALHAGTMLAKLLPGSILEKHRVAFFMRANSNLYTASKSSRLQFEFFDLFSPIENHFERLNRLDPTLLFAPPSMLRALAKARSDSLITARPKKIFSIAETLDPLDQKVIEKGFGQMVHQVYQCTEGFLGITCSRGTLHLNEDCVRIEKEWLDEGKTKFIPIVTDFSRTSQPIIRYRLNDILTLSREPCACGSPFTAISDIEGRADDIILFETENRETVSVFPDFIRRSIIRASEKIEEYAVIQRIRGELEIALLCSNDCAHDAIKEVRSKVETEINKLAIEMSARTPHISFLDQMPGQNGKKLRRIRQEMKI